MWKNLSLRLKRPGMKRATDRVEGMMNLVGVYKSGPKTSTGNREKPHAAEINGRTW
jgi:hypothetical protein